ncbi:MAG: hypothetical protein HRU33_14520 [Rhodobacteraceae bacterium]|nr:hypothetical protein [Paracoccaceae bacterium]
MPGYEFQYARIDYCQVEFFTKFGLDLDSAVIRSLLTEIRLIPDGDLLGIELVGELASLLSLGQTQNARSDYVTGGSTTLVAGGRNQRYRTKLKSRV